MRSSFLSVKKRIRSNDDNDRPINYTYIIILYKIKFVLSNRKCEGWDKSTWVIPKVLYVIAFDWVFLSNVLQHDASVCTILLLGL